MTPLLAKLKEEETRKELLVVELESLMKCGHITELDEARLKRDLRQRVSDSKALLSRHKAQARQVLRKLLDQPLMFLQSSENGKAGYKVTGQGSLLKLLPDQLITPCVVSPTGTVKPRSIPLTSESTYWRRLHDLQRSSFQPSGTTSLQYRF